MNYIDKRNEVDALQQHIGAAGELDTDIKKKIYYKFRLDWNYYSNSMEGNTLTMEETRSVMVGNLTVGGKPIKDVLEIKGHDKIISEILRIGRGEIRLSEKRIREIHSAIIYEEDESKRDKIGKWKTEPNYLFNYKGERFDFTAPDEVPVQLHDLLNRTNAAIDAILQKKKDAPHPIDIALQFHLEYVKIHPFYDGNGRTARILTNLLLIAFGYPPFWIKTTEREMYNRYLGDIQGYGGVPDLFMTFAAGLIMRSQQIIRSAIAGEDITEEEDYLKEIRLIKQKTENAGLPKSPIIVYRVFTAVKDEVWLKLEETLKKFDVLFVESKTTHHVNYLDEIFQKKTLLDSVLITVSTKPDEIKVFGHNLYKKDVNRIEWQHVKYGLSGSEDSTNINVNLLIQFDKKTFHLYLYVNRKTVYSIEKNYNDMLFSDDIKIMNKELVKHLLSDIKMKTSEQ